MINTALVLGASGKSGRRLVPLLENRGVTVRRASRTGLAGNTLFDWNQPETHAAALAGTDAVYLIVADPAVDPDALVGPFLQRARAAGVRRIVAVSSLGVTFPEEPVDSPRLKLERLIAESGIDWTMLRPGGFNQNFSEGFLLPGIQAGMVVSATGDGKVGFVDAEDIAAVAAEAMTGTGHAGQSYALTGPDLLGFADAAAIISAAAGRPIGHRPLSAEQLGEILQGAGLPSASAAIVLRDQIAISNGHAAVVTDLVETLTGRAARTFRDFATAAAVTWQA